MENGRDEIESASGRVESPDPESAGTDGVRGSGSAEDGSTITDPDTDGVASADAPAVTAERGAAAPKGYLAAVLGLSGKQHYVRVGDDVEIRCETLDEIPTDEAFEVTELLLAFKQGDNDHEPRTVAFGTPYLEGATASLKYKSARKNAGISFKKRRRKHSSKTLRGYRNYTVRFAVEGLSIPGVGQETLIRSDEIEASDAAGG